MKIVVTVKLVPDPNGEKKIDPATKRLVRTGVETVINPYDEYALEAALQLKERIGGESTVTVFCMSPESLKESLRKALAMGADGAVMLSDSSLEGSDVWASAHAMSLALKRIGFDILIVGGLTDDGSTGAVPGALAEFLGVPCLTNVRKIDIADGKVRVERETDSGYQEVTGALPMLVTTALTIGEPRYPSLKGIMGAKKKPIDMLSVADIGAADTVGATGSKTELLSFAPPPARGAGQIVTPEDPAAGAAMILAFLKEKKLV